MGARSCTTATPNPPGATMGKHVNNAANLSKGTDSPRHAVGNERTEAIRIDTDSTGRVIGWGVGRETGDGNYSR